MRLERFVPAVDFNALCWASVAALPLFSWQVVDTLIPFAPYQQFDRYFAFHIFAYAIRYLVVTLGMVGISLAVGGLFQRKAAELLSFSLSVNALVVAALILLLQLPLAIASIARSYDSQALRYAVIMTVLSDASVLVAVGVASRLYVAWRTSPDVRRSAAIFGIALALAIIDIVRSLDWLQRASGSMSMDIMFWANDAVFRLIYAVGDVALFGNLAIGILRRTGRDGQLGAILLAAISAALAWWVILFGPHLIVLSIKSGVSPGSEFNPYPVGAIVRTALFGAAAGLFYFAVVYREAARELLTSLPTLISSARRWRPTNLDD